jgi:hypothetical protein
VADHPNTRLLARYALGDVTDDAELAALEDHLMSCDECRRRAVAVDLIGTAPDDGGKLTLHIAAGGGDTPVAVCGDEAIRNIISPDLLAGFDRSVICTRCLALVQRAN